MALMVEGVFAGDERLPWLGHVWFAMSRVMPALLLMLGLAQLRSKRWLYWPTLLWTAAALVLLLVALALVVVILASPQGVGSAVTAGLVLLLLAAPYPLILLGAARQARRQTP